MCAFQKVTDEGLEKNFSTNTLGTHLLTEGLAPLLRKSEDARVVVVSSGGMLTQKLDVGDLQSERMSPFDGTMVYAQNKRQQVVMTRKYAERYKDVFFVSMHPGEPLSFLPTHSPFPPPPKKNLIY